MRPGSRILSDYEGWVRDNDPAADFGEERQYEPQHGWMYRSGGENKLTVNELQKLLVRQYDSNILWLKMHAHMSGAESLTSTMCWVVAMLVVILALILIRLRMVQPQQNL
ncbi:hypothetical protein BDV34DRAFT_228558 [Aspergillus parasiticus]|uniref:Uncharacterized protein n=1 Tax=Aspergillus parasiticus TaxID=5067 RepID=A0A5N6DAS4_ASPPA|nr:hypothetical protein BDV34DRAFT_228558 [Aspergillus parasiticus]